MREAACSGDADTFFVYVDEDKLDTNIMMQFEGAALLEGRPDVLLQTDLMRAAARSGSDAWRKDINENGKDSGPCGWTLAGIEKIGDTQRVEVRSKVGSHLLYFAKVDGRLKLIQFRAVEARNDEEAGRGRVGLTGPAMGWSLEAEKQKVEQQQSRLKAELEQTKDPEKIAALQAQLEAEQRKVEMIKTQQATQPEKHGGPGVCAAPAPRHVPSWRLPPAPR
jgi:hypothetical protein